MSLLRKYIGLLLEQASSNIMIPDPPSLDYRTRELQTILSYRESPVTPPELKEDLDTGTSKMFDQIVTAAGYDSLYEKIELLKRSMIPIITEHKNHFGSLRPNELADQMGVDFEFDYLESAQTPSYPSGHTAQAFWVAHNLSDMFPELEREFFRLAQMIADSRIDRGVHFPSDNRAGKALADAVYFKGRNLQ